MSLQFGFVIFWQKDFGTKAAHKMLVKLTPSLPSKGDSILFDLDKCFLGMIAFVSMVGVYPCLAYKCWLLSLLQIWDLAEKLSGDLTSVTKKKIGL